MLLVALKQTHCSRNRPRETVHPRSPSSGYLNRIRELARNTRDHAIEPAIWLPVASARIDTLRYRRKEHRDLYDPRVLIVARTEQQRRAKKEERREFVPSKRKRQGREEKSGVDEE